MALTILDASVVIAHLDKSDAHHAAVEAHFDRHAGDDYRLPASAYAEALVGPLRRGGLEAARSAMRTLGILIAPIGEEVGESAAALRAENPALRLPDALVLACAETLEADLVLTTDRRWRRYDRVQVVD